MSLLLSVLFILFRPVFLLLPLASLTRGVKEVRGAKGSKRSAGPKGSKRSKGTKRTKGSKGTKGNEGSKRTKGSYYILSNKSKTGLKLFFVDPSYTAYRKILNVQQLDTVH